MCSSPQPDLRSNMSWIFCKEGSASTVAPPLGSAAPAFSGCSDACAPVTVRPIQPLEVLAAQRQAEGQVL